MFWRISLPQAGDGFAVLHDEELDRATTGRGPVRDADEALLRTLFLRDADGRATQTPVLVFPGLCRTVAAANGAGRLQLDLQCGLEGLTEAAVARFAAAARPVAVRMILGAADALRESLDFARVIERAIAEAPLAGLVYLDKALVLPADRHGFDLVAPFHAAGREVDAYTVTTADEEAAAIVPRLVALGVDEITSDDAEGLLRRFG